MKPSLSKSDFKVAQTCATKLYYKKKGYPTSTEENEYLLMLADGGYMVGKMALLLYDGGVEILTDKGTEIAIKETEDYLKRENITLFEPAIYSKNKLVRIDILEKKGNKFNLIEVKSKSFSSKDYQAAQDDGKKYFELSEWREYIEDVAFQKMVLKEKFPSAEIEAYLLMPDKAKTTPIEGLIDWFNLQKPEIIGESRFRKTDVLFSGNLNELRKGHILELVKVDEYADKVSSEVIDKSTHYINSLLKDEKIVVPISTNCSKCEFSVSDSEVKNGFKECWKDLAETKPNILNLGQLGNFNRSKEKPIDTLISKKKVSLYDVPLELIQDKYNNRPYYQVTKDEEFLLKECVPEFQKVQYPLHFIDFETSQMAIPYHAGMRPYGKVIFQWSCHTIVKPGAAPIHRDWINVEDKYPNFKFAESLRNVLGDHGSIMIWSLYENTMLKDVFNSFDTMSHVDVSLKDWLSRTISFTTGAPSRFIDMNNLTLKYYFHPNMGGRTSIKVTLPSVLKATRSEKIKNLLSSVNLYKLDEGGSIMDPYKLLPPLEIEGANLDVANGTDAMKAYQEMLYGANKNNAGIKDGYKNALLQYCRLDTLAMVIIWEHWNDLLL